MTTANEGSSGMHPDYGHQPSPWERAWARFQYQERCENVWKSVFPDTPIHSTGGLKRLILAFGVAFVSGGLGLAIEGAQSTTAPFWMWLGGFLIGLIIPLSKWTDK
jgi:hypothetical protein